MSFATFLYADHVIPLFIGGGRSCWRSFVEPYRCGWGLIELKVDSGKWKVNNTLSLALPQGRGQACDAQSSAFHSPLLFHFYMERVPKAGEGIINLGQAHTRGRERAKTSMQAHIAPLSFYISTWRGCRRRERVL